MPYRRGDRVEAVTLALGDIERDDLTVDRGFQDLPASDDTAVSLNGSSS
jgi:hypothetical protein